MTIAPVAGQVGTATSASTTSLAVTVPSGITQGNLVVAMLGFGGGATGFTGPSGWTQAGSGVVSSGGVIATQVWYLVVDAGHAGQTSFTFSWSGGGNGPAAYAIREWNSTTGWQASPVDKSSTGNTSGTTLSTGSTATTTQASELWVAALGWGDTGQTESGLTAGFTSGQLATVTGASMREAYEVVSTTGAALCQETLGTFEQTACQIATFMPAAAVTVTAATLVQPLAPGWHPGFAPSSPGGEPFVPWPLYPASAGQADLLNATQTITATITATLVNAPSAWELPPQYPPAWFPSAPSAPGAEPFTAWQVGLYGVNADTLNAAQVITATGAAALTEAKPLNAAQTVTATGAAALTEAKPLNAALTVTATGAAALTESKPLNAAQTVTATATASMTVSKAAQVPVPEYPPGWFPAAPGVPAGEPFAPWPVWSGFGGHSTPQDSLNAAAAITATGAAALTEAKPVNAAQTATATAAAALTESKPLNAAQTVTATAAASLATSKPLNAAQTVTAGRAAAETTAKPLNAAATVTATAAASLSDVHAPSIFATTAPLYAPRWFPGAPGLPMMEPFAPWPPRQSQNLLTLAGKQGTVAVLSTLANSVTISNALDGSVRAVTTLAGSVTIGNTL